jgi:hypothetical protein
MTGHTTANDISNFTAATELQYDRLTKWAKGNSCGTCRELREATLERATR